MYRKMANMNSVPCILVGTFDSVGGAPLLSFYKFLALGVEEMAILDMRLSGGCWGRQLASLA